MKLDDDALGQRWTERSPGDPARDHAAALLRRVPSPPALSPAQLERIARRLEPGHASPWRARSWRTALVAATACAAAVAVLTGFRARQGRQSERIAPSIVATQTALAPPAGPTARVPAISASPPTALPRPTVVIARPDAPLPGHRRVRSVAAASEAAQPVAPSLATRPTASAPPVEPAPTSVLPAASPAETELAAEQRLLGTALRALRAHDGAQALAALDEYQVRFPHGTLVPESRQLRIDALLRTERRGEALLLLEGLSLAGAARERELYVVRGELRAEAGRVTEAEEDFNAALAGLSDEIEERALYGHASCLARRGNTEGARVELRRYLEDFPLGRFADRVRRELAR